jgi:hypothetical protein
LPACFPARRGTGRRRSSYPKCRFRSQRPFAPLLRDGQRCPARTAADVEDAASGSEGNRFDEQVFERLEHLVKRLLRFDLGVSGEAVPKRRLLIIGLVRNIP